MRVKTADGMDGRSEYNSIDSAGADSIGAHDRRFSVRVKRTSRQVERLQNLAAPTNGFHLSVMGNIVLGSDAFDSLGYHGAVAHNDRAHWHFTTLASNFGQFQTQTHIRFMQRVIHLFHSRKQDGIAISEETKTPASRSYSCLKLRRPAAAFSCSGCSRTTGHSETIYLNSTYRVPPNSLDQQQTAYYANQVIRHNSPPRTARWNVEPLLSCGGLMHVLTK
jgi:hypothetical protein